MPQQQPMDVSMLLNSSNLEAELRLLINLSGKMRMLSHRIVMSAQQAKLVPADQDRAMSLFDAALNEFAQLARTLQHGSREHDISAETARHLNNGEAFQSDKVYGVIEHFAASARDMQTSLKQGTGDATQLTNLAYFVADELLSTLNTITNGASQTLQNAMDKRHESEDETRKKMLVAAQSINDVATKVKLISLNASIEAARAGEAGKGFNVIAHEIRELSEDAAKSSNQIAEQLAKAG
jgi:methyl-accepting chemotaxis protein